jgi:predicted Zn-dependent protease
VSTDRIVALEAMLARRPDDPRLRYGLAIEYLGAGRLEEGIRELRTYLEASDDEGNGWGRLGAALRESGAEGEARDAYRRAVQAALLHGHPTMAAEYEALLESWEG